MKVNIDKAKGALASTMDSCLLCLWGSNFTFLGLLGVSPPATLTAFSLLHPERIPVGLRFCNSSLTFLGDVAVVGTCLARLNAAMCGRSSTSDAAAGKSAALAVTTLHSMLASLGA
ncbi:hypothetical protein AKJ16_DCAP15189 [Drosera capensis]